MKEQIQELSQAFEKVQADRDFDQEWKDFMNGNS
jgi:tripartite-type tricarboxylate transporter receptor subunit TctC